MKYIKKYIDLRLLLVSILLPIGLNIYGQIFFLRSLAGGGSDMFPKFAVEKSIAIACYAANWPSILIKIYPYTVSQKGDIEVNDRTIRSISILKVKTLSYSLANPAAS